MRCLTCLFVKERPCRMDRHAQIPNQMVQEGLEISKLWTDLLSPPSVETDSSRDIQINSMKTVERFS